MRQKDLNAHGRPAGKKSRHAITAGRRGRPRRPDLSVLLPPPGKLARAGTLAETIDWRKAEADANGVTLRQARAAERRLASGRRALDGAWAIENRSRRAMAAALGANLKTARALLAKPRALVALCHMNKVKLTRATLASPCLPYMKACHPSLNARTQSHFARVLNYGLAAGLGADDFAKAVESFGAVRIAKWETQRRAIRNGAPPKTDDDRDVVARFVQSRSPMNLDEVGLPADGGLLLIVAGAVGGKLAAYAADGDPARLLPVLRQFIRSGTSGARKEPPPGRRPRRPRAGGMRTRAGRRAAS